MSEKEENQERPQRSQYALRALIDEMLTRLREASNTGDWTPESRARMEEELSRLMEMVRLEALRDR
jgi:hypothetical protein